MFVAYNKIFDQKVDCVENLNSIIELMTLFIPLFLSFIKIRNYIQEGVLCTDSLAVIYCLHLLFTKSIVNLMSDKRNSKYQYSTDSKTFKYAIK